MIDSRHNGALKAKLAARRADILDALGAGVAPEMYLRLVGQLDGLADAVKLSNDADYELNGGS